MLDSMTALMVMHQGMAISTHAYTTTSSARRSGLRFSHSPNASSGSITGRLRRIPVRIRALSAAPALTYMRAYVPPHSSPSEIRNISGNCSRKIVRIAPKPRIMSNCWMYSPP